MNAPGKGRGGFTLAELLVVMAILSLLAGLAIPNLQRAVLKARAADAIGDLEVIRVAVLQYQADRHEWPPDRNRGQIPPGLEEYLPDGFSFVGDDYIMDYDNWSRNRGFVGLTIITQEPALGDAMLSLLGDGTWTNGRDKFTWVLDWTE